MKLKDVLIVLLKSFLMAIGMTLISGVSLYFVFDKPPLTGEILNLFEYVLGIVGFGFSFLIGLLIFFSDKRHKIRLAVMEEKERKAKEEDDKFWSQHTFFWHVKNDETGEIVNSGNGKYAHLLYDKSLPNESVN